MLQDSIIQGTNLLTTGSGAPILGLLALFGTGILFTMLIWYILQVIAYWKIFTKAGRPGWHSIVPFLNLWDRYDLSWSRTAAWAVVVIAVAQALLEPPGDAAARMSAATSLGRILAGAYAILRLIGAYKLSRAFGKGIGFFLGLIFLEPVFMLILGFGSARYIGPDGAGHRG